MGGPHELKVVDDNEVESHAGLHAPGLGSEIESPQSRRIVNEKITVKLLRGIIQAAPVVIRKIAGLTELAEAHLGTDGNQT